MDDQLVAYKPRALSRAISAGAFQQMYGAEVSAVGPAQNLKIKEPNRIQI